MALVMTPIYTRVLDNNNTNTVTFNNIPQVYTDLLLVASMRTTPTGYGEDGVNISFNGDSSAVYSYTRILGDGSSPTSSRLANNTVGQWAVSATSSSSNVSFGSSSMYLPNYTSSNFKSFIGDTVTERNATNTLSGMYSGLWRSTAAITSMSISTATLAQNSSFSLYGIIRSGA